MSRRIRIVSGIVVTISVALLSHSSEEAAVRAELEAMEDLRMLHRFAVQNLHDSMTLAVYLSAWGGPDMSESVENGFVETEALYDVLHAVDNGAMGLRAALDCALTNDSLSKALTIVGKARAEAAERTGAHYVRTMTLKELLVSNVIATASQKAKWTVVTEPAPWDDIGRERERRCGIRFSRLADEKFFKMTPEDRDEMLRKNRRMGYTGLDVIWDPVSNWGDIEKSKGNFDFAALDSIMEQAGQVGLPAVTMHTQFVDLVKRLVRRHEKRSEVHVRLVEQVCWENWGTTLNSNVQWVSCNHCRGR